MAIGDHLYTTSAVERDQAIERHGYADEGVACSVYHSAPAPATDAPVPFYRLYAPGNGDHFYTTFQPEADSAARGGYNFEGVACPIHTNAGPSRVPFYRLYNPGNGDHFYTTNAGERDNAVNGGYVSEGIAGYTYSTSAPDRVPLYRLYNPANGDHFYTTSQQESNYAIAGGYTDEGIACYVPGNSPPVPSRIPLYRLASTADHFYTTNETERLSAINSGYVPEGIQCYVPASAVASSTPLYRLYNPGNGDHFYTTNAAERDSAAAGGYALEGIACQVFLTTIPETVPLYRLYRGMSKYVGVNVILVGNDTFTAGDRQRVRDSLAIVRQIYAQVSIGLDRVSWFGIPAADAGANAVIDSQAEAVDLTDDWTCANDSLDLFVVRTMNGADGWSAVGGSCDKNAKGMTGSVVSLNGTLQNSGNTFAHEMGHYLGLDHIADAGNFIGGDGASDSWTGIYQWQGNQMKKHCFMHT
jgi:hypothetical protein